MDHKPKLANILAQVRHGYCWFPTTTYRLHQQVQSQQGVPFFVYASTAPRMEMLKMLLKVLFIVHLLACLTLGISEECELGSCHFAAAASVGVFNHWFLNQD